MLPTHRACPISVVYACLFQVGKQYLEYVVGHCNSLFDANAAKVVRLATEFRQCLYPAKFTLKPISLVASPTATSAPAQPSPGTSDRAPLVLSRWGHTVTSLGPNHRAVVFGGYGCNGHELTGVPAASQSRMLSRLHDLVMMEHVTTAGDITTTTTSRPPPSHWRGTAMTTVGGTPPSSRMFHSANSIHATPHVTSALVVFGGRQSPQHPLNDVHVLVELASSTPWVQHASSLRWLQPVRVAGAPPSPRWRHAAVTLDGEASVLVYGGRDAEHVLSDAYVLKISFAVAASAVGGECEGGSM